MQIMHRAKTKSLPDNIQKFFSIKECKYNFRGVVKFTVQKAKKEIKRRCISVVGVKLWNNADENIRICNSLLVFKKMVYYCIFEGYKCE